MLAREKEQRDYYRQLTKFSEQDLDHCKLILEIKETNPSPQAEPVLINGINFFETSTADILNQWRNLIQLCPYQFFRNDKVKENFKVGANQLYKIFKNLETLKEEKDKKQLDQFHAMLHECHQTYYNQVKLFKEISERVLNEYSSEQTKISDLKLDDPKQMYNEIIKLREENIKMHNELIELKKHIKKLDNRLDTRLRGYIEQTHHQWGEYKRKINEKKESMQSDWRSYQTLFGKPADKFLTQVEGEPSVSDSITEKVSSFFSRH